MLQDSGGVRTRNFISRPSFTARVMALFSPAADGLQTRPLRKEGRRDHAANRCNLQQLAVGVNEHSCLSVAGAGCTVKLACGQPSLPWVAVALVSLAALGCIGV